MNLQTIFSPDRCYRYTLWRDFEQSADLITEYSPTTMQNGFVQFIGLNPSTADEKLDDPTIRRCIGFSKAWGYAALCMTNLFAFRATDPKVMMAAPLPIGLENDQYLYEIATEASLIICAWGNTDKSPRGKFVVARLREVAGQKLHHLGLNKDGSPRHPLYLPATTQPILWEATL